jgi:hypothetical protein
MRDLTEQEDNKLNQGQCPFCGSLDFYEGPSGAGSVNIACAEQLCEAKFCYHGGTFTAQLIEEPHTPLPKRSKPVSKPTDDIDFDGDAFLDFMSPPKDKTAVAVTKRKANRYYNIATRTVKEYFAPLVRLYSGAVFVIKKLREKD